MAEPRTAHRSIRERWVITGTLELLSPAHFGNGSLDALVDMPLLFDEASGKPLLLGTSIAGALRNYLREKHTAYGQPEEKESLAGQLFGGRREDDEGGQSALIVYDALGEAAGIELRDGVAICAETGTAEDDKKFDIQLLAAGSTFGLRFELSVGAKQDSLALRSILAEALVGLESGQISLGARKQRGFGACQAKDWVVQKYDLTQAEPFLAWLASERDWGTEYAANQRPEAGSDIQTMLDSVLSKEDQRQQAHLSATFAIDGTLMIRSGFGETDKGPDMVHIHSPRHGKKERVPVIPGTSWAGVLRHRALKIARTLSNNRFAVDEEGQPLTKANGKPRLDAEVFVDSMFGPSEIKREEKNGRASKVLIRESGIINAESLVITRVKIDRFTGGVLESALFSEQPVVGSPLTQVTLDLCIRNPSEPEVGLLLLLLKDLWTGDLPVGGESGVGRGRLSGVHARLEIAKDCWEFQSAGKDGVSVTPESGIEQLNTYVSAFNQMMKNGGAQ